MARSLNRVQLIGNLTRDPELRYTPSGAAVCSFGLATNRTWKTDTGEKHEDTEFHRVVAWNKLAELCSQFLTKGRKVYVEGRLSTRAWTAQDGTSRSQTEVVIDDMILLDSRRQGEPATEAAEERVAEEPTKPAPVQPKVKKPVKKTEEETINTDGAKSDEDEVVPDDIPF